MEEQSASNSDNDISVIDRISVLYIFYFLIVYRRERREKIRKSAKISLILFLVLPDSVTFAVSAVS